MNNFFTLAKKMSDLFFIDTQPNTKIISFSDAKKDNKILLIDNINVCGIEPLNEHAYWFLTNYITNDIDRFALSPILQHKEIGKAKYSIKYFDRIIKVVKCCSDSITFIQSKDYPLEIYFTANKDTNVEMQFRIILAPRVEND